MKEIEIDLLPHQDDFACSESYITAMACAVSVGKSFVVAFRVLKALIEGKKIILFAPFRDQIKNVILPEIEEMADKWDVALDVNRTNFTIRHKGGIALAFSNKNYNKIRGLTKVSLAVIDEAQDVLPDVLPIVEARMRAVRNPQILITGTGASTQCWWAKTAMHPETNLIRADIYSNVRYNGREYVERLVKRYADMPEEFVRRELYGEFVDGGENGLFAKINEAGAWNGDERVTAGLDIAGTGSDKTCMFVMQGNKLLHIETRNTPTHKETYEFVDEMHKKFQFSVMRYDATGMGNQYSFAGKPFKVIGVVFGAAANFKFHDQRARIYYQCRDMCLNGIVPSPQMRQPYHIQSKHWEMTKFELLNTNTVDDGTSKIRIEEKKFIKKRIKHSPDRADAFVLACVPQAVEAPAENVPMPGSRSWWGN